PAASGKIRAVITDFGLASRQVGGPAEPQNPVGHPDYMAPELLKSGNPSVASDIYALGGILFELATRGRPFPPDAPLDERLTRKPAPVKHPWNSILQKCLHPDPTNRYGSVTAVRKALEWGASWRRRVVATAVVAAAGLLIIPKP